MSYMYQFWAFSFWRIITFIEYLFYLFLCSLLFDKELSVLISRNKKAKRERNKVTKKERSIFTRSTQDWMIRAGFGMISLEFRFRICRFLTPFCLCTRISEDIKFVFKYTYRYIYTCIYMYVRNFHSGKYTVTEHSRNQYRYFEERVQFLWKEQKKLHPATCNSGSMRWKFQRIVCRLWEFMVQ